MKRWLVECCRGLDPLRQRVVEELVERGLRDADIRELVEDLLDNVLRHGLVPRVVLGHVLVGRVSRSPGLGLRQSRSTSLRGLSATRRRTGTRIARGLSGSLRHLCSMLAFCEGRITATHEHEGHCVSLCE